jgi:fructose-bisphosphate aldolase class II
MARIAEIHDKLPNTHLVMHGSSSVPQELQDLINAFGGECRRPYGVPVEEIVKGIKTGVRKVNIDTDCRMAMTGQFRKTAQENPSEFDPRKFLIPAMAAMEAALPRPLRSLRDGGQRLEDQVIPMDDMAKRYADGALDPGAGHAAAA